MSHIYLIDCRNRIHFRILNEYVMIRKILTLKTKINQVPIAVYTEKPIKIKLFFSLINVEVPEITSSLSVN